MSELVEKIHHLLDSAAEVRAKPSGNGYGDIDDFMSAAHTIGRMGEPAIPILLPFLTHANPYLREAAVTSLGMIPSEAWCESVETLMMFDASQVVRLQAFFALQKLDHKRLARILISYLQDTRTDQCLYAIQFLGNLADPQYIPDLQKLMNKTQNDEIRQKIQQAIRDISR